MIRRSNFTNLVVPNAFGDEKRWWSVSGTPQFDDSGDFTGYCGSGADITSQREFSESASRLAKYDSLTDLPNRLRMSEVLNAHLSKYHLHKQPCAILLIDLDRFKQVNDTMGHPAGDALLKLVSQRLLKIVGDRERIFRLGGDEFTVFVPNTEDKIAIAALGDEIIGNLSEPYLIDGKRSVIGASVGIAVSPQDGVTAEELIRNADLALYGSKADGRGCTSFFSQELLEAAKDRKGIEEDLRDAIAKDEFEVHYQPIVDSKENRTTGVEALLRWHHPARGPISPEIFIPIAEEANLVSALGEWVLRKACHDAASWPGKIRVAVNVSPIQFTSGLLPNLVVSALANSGLEAHRLEFEITEGVFIGVEEDTDEVFDSLKRIGVRLALDDFGTGYSSLGYLRTAPFDKIKIDKSFVHAATLPGSRNAAIIAAIVALADALDMETTAEGIETEDQLALIRNLRVSHVQGYIYSKPVPNADVKERLQSGNWDIAPSGPTNQRSNRISMYRKVNAIFGNHCRSVLIRNLSETGALIEGLDNVPIGSKLIIDFGDGQLTFASLVRSQSRQYGVKFESPLVSDEEGRLRPRSRVPILRIKSAGLPRNQGVETALEIGEDNGAALERFRAKLGIDPQTTHERTEGDGPADTNSQTDGNGVTLGYLAKRHLDSIGNDRARHQTESTLLESHILPHLGHLRPDEITPAYMSEWFDVTSQKELLDQVTINKLKSLLKQLGVQNLEDAENMALSRRATLERYLSDDEVKRLNKAVAESHNQQLRYLVSLLMITGVRQRDLMDAQWDHFDLEAGLWHMPVGSNDETREVRLSNEAIDLIDELPRLDGCPYLLANPKTGMPYKSFASSWQTVLEKADLYGLEIDDVRNCVETQHKAKMTPTGAGEADQVLSARSLNS
ncbi:MAG: EAL domain-containing protein [Pseudomonadota bacterium]